MPLIIYYHPNSEPCRAVFALALFLNIPHEIRLLDIYKGDARTPEFREINPFGKVPTIIDEDGTILSESHTILRYLCRKYKAPDHWYPSDALAAAKVDLYLDWHMTNTRRVYNFFIASVTPIFPKGHFDSYDLEEERKVVTRSLKLIENVWLKENKFLGGKEISIADISAAAQIISLITFKWKFEEYPKMKDWLERVMGIEEMKKAHEGFYQIAKDLEQGKTPFPKF